MLDNCVCCGKVIPEGRHICRRCEIGVTIRPAKVSNGDKIRAMTNDELAGLFDNIATSCCAGKCERCVAHLPDGGCNFHVWLDRGD